MTADRSIILRCLWGLAYSLGARPMPITEDGQYYVWPANSIAVVTQRHVPMFWPLIPESEKDER